MALKLYEAAEAVRIVNEWVEERAEEIIAAGGELPADLVALLDQAEGDFAEKVERVAMKVRELEAEAEAIKVEAKRLQERAAVRTRAADNLKLYLKRQMDAANETKVSGLVLTVAVQNNPPKVECDLAEEDLAELSSLGLAYVQRTVSYTLDKKAVLVDWKANGTINAPSGIRVVQDRSLRIK